MDESFNERINKLRERSRYYLTQVNENCKKVKELRRLYSQSLSSRENYSNDTDGPSLLHRRSNKSWKLRNDSSGVGGVLCSDYFYNSPRRTFASMPNIPKIKKVLTSSKKRSENLCCSNHNRRPIKECYCNYVLRTNQLRPGKAQQKQHSPCKCKSPIYTRAVVVEDDEIQHITSPISCETLRRVQRIDYTPRSQFLRNVQSKVSLLQATTASGDCRGPCSRGYPDFTFKRDDIDSMYRTSDQKSELSKDKSSELQTIDKSSKVSLKKQSNPSIVVKRTLSSSKSVPDSKKSNSKVSSKSKRISIKKECTCGHGRKSQNSKTTTGKDDASEDYQFTVCTNKLNNEQLIDEEIKELKKFHDRMMSTNEHLTDEEVKELKKFRDKMNSEHLTDEEVKELKEIRDRMNSEHLTDEEVKELKKFREKNYFDTHGSDHTLVSKSSGSLEQYELNDRLFPEPTKKIHKKDLVVTMPPCATIQRKRIHYFPRYIVRQEKNNIANCSKKKHCQTCPLTGHAIDLGITKIRAPLNSLALKYQKRLP